MRSTRESAHRTARTSRVRYLHLAARATLAASGMFVYTAVIAAPAMAAIGYPDPGGIYAPFTDCPLHDPIMRQAEPGFAMGCIKSITASGTFTINGVPVQFTHPVTVQFGTYSDLDATGNQVFHVVPPADGKQLLAEPEVIPGGLLLLVCSSADPSVARLCETAMRSGQTDLSVQVQLAGPITNFSPLAESPFTLPVKVQLGNPLLGGTCFIGSDSDPIVLNPLFNPVGELAFASDPDPVAFPNVAVLSIRGSTLTDDVFSVPDATGCGPGGVANAAINGTLGLPSPSGNNHLVLTGNDALFADDFSNGGQAQDLLAAFRASVGLPPASPSGAFVN
jgi:hypothetical protein